MMKRGEMENKDRRLQNVTPKCVLTLIIPCYIFNHLKPELNLICYLLALLGAHHFLHVSRI